MASRWWGKAWVRAVEEAAYSHPDLLASRRLARSGQVGQIMVEEGRFVCSVDDDRGLWTVVGTLPVLDDAQQEALVETVAAEAGRIAALMAGDLPHLLVEHAEEAGVELLPYGGELGSQCSCDHWVDPCPHALAGFHQLVWLSEADPFVLFHLRGLPREELLARLHARSSAAVPEVGGADALGEAGDVETGLDAALRAARLLEVLGGDSSGSVEHLF